MFSPGGGLAGRKHGRREGSYIVKGKIKRIISELPVGTWTQNYRENVLETMLAGADKTDEKKKKKKDEDEVICRTTSALLHFVLRLASHL